jgi:hypothetical protein
VLLQNNIFAGTGEATTQVNATDRTNFRSLLPPLVDRLGFDLHPLAGSALIGAGSAVGVSASGVSLAPTLQYKHVAGTEPRPVAAALAIGAYAAQ